MSIFCSVAALDMNESKLKVGSVCALELLNKATPCLCNHSLWESPDHFFVLLFCTFSQFPVWHQKHRLKSTTHIPLLEEFAKPFLCTEYVSFDVFLFSFCPLWTTLSRFKKVVKFIISLFVYLFSEPRTNVHITVARLCLHKIHE